MKTNRPQMILVAILVCLFAVGMAGLLNFFKYRSIAEGIVQERLVATGQAIEYNIQSSLAVGMSFSDIGTLPGALERERATDSLILSIDRSEERRVGKERRSGRVREDSRNME